MFRFLKLCIAWMALASLSACSQPTAAPDLPVVNTPVYSGDHIGHFGYGKAATADQIAGWDIDIRPDGQGLPVGSGSVEDGELLYEEQCAECHGSFGEGVGRYPVLAGGEGSLSDDRPSKTVGSYWPYTSTLFDYIYRAMPFAQPESLSADETYALTAYVLYLNDLVEDDLNLNQSNLASIRLPNEGNFVPDPRPDVANIRCMQDCRDPSLIKFLSEVQPEPAENQSPVELETVQAVTHPGQVNYDQYCSICHKVGVGGAPIMGDEASWIPRLENGIDALVNNAINGISSDNGVMPPKGGFLQLSDQDVRDATTYMIGESS
jgi:cytochrome c5